MFEEFPNFHDLRSDKLAIIKECLCGARRKKLLKCDESTSTNASEHMSVGHKYTAAGVTETR